MFRSIFKTSLSVFSSPPNGTNGDVNWTLLKNIKRGVHTTQSSSQKFSLRQSLINTRQVSHVVDDVTTTQEPLTASFKSVPGPKGLPILGTLLDYSKKDGFRFNKMFQAFRQRSLEHGPIFKEKIATIQTVVISDPQEYAKVIRADGKYPFRREMEPMAHYRIKKGMGLGLVNSQGEEWHKYRTVLAPKMLKPKEVLEYLPEMDVVADDFVVRLGAILNTHSEVPHLDKELFKWAMESIGTVLFEERLGCFDSPPPARARHFITNLMGYFKLMQPLMYNVPIYKVYRTKLWRRFEQYADSVIGVGQQFVNKVNQLQQQSRDSTTTSTCPLSSVKGHDIIEPVDGSDVKGHTLTGVEGAEVKGQDQEKDASTFLSYMLSQDTLTHDEVNSTVVDLLMGAVETTSNAVIWTLYCLANNPRVQEKVYAEVQSAIPTGGAVTPDVLGNIPYVKAVLKETLRVFPITFATSRFLQEDTEIFGYTIPAGTHVQANLYGMGQDEELFPEPEAFLPERWLRGGANNNFTGFSNLVWGHGARMCIGRRIAEQEIYLLLVKIMQKFKLQYNHEPVEPVLNTIMTPDRPVKLTLIPRNDTTATMVTHDTHLKNVTT